MDPVFLTLDEVLEIHRQQIERYGGSGGIRDAAALESLRGEHPSVVDGIQWRYRIEPGAVAIEASDDLPLELKHPLPLEVRLPRPTADRQQGATKAAPTESGLAPGPARDSIGRR